ncbi:major facilitator superfamily MFS_1 [Beutenbergia cavernae DSM 12333]|uniref:Major facilitator superfamily MFS_1 n=1 Tax=Beutenbergia cavernae (strain ATCC BAA-8 / DSM 12333 / CCUG 43141 / JCM 11478 / NBRC 16432 / NCIMB 13614 / HKI 0122) TaxID=471853 RepID=C5C259_BEUC1|nr:MFS transporter [Beutenbergia cavernae]ACQ81684.1 major facilitator superfamily MFS_1 [Beutenbergia cavernae DSM 12333]
MTATAVATDATEIETVPADATDGVETPETQPRTRGFSRNVTKFLVGQTTSLFGSMVVQYAVMWYVTLETRSGFAVALYAIAAFAPQGLVSIFGGVLADRMNRRVLAMTADAVIATVTLALALIMLTGVTELWIILLAVAVRSLGAGVQTPAVQAMIPQIAPEDQLMRVNGTFSTIQSAMALLAPAVAGGVYGAFGIVPIFFLDVVTAAIGISLLARVAVPTLTAVAEKTSSYREDLVGGLRYVRHNPVVRWLLGVFAIMMLLTGAPSFITPLMVARTFGSDVWMVTVLEVAFSVGMILGGVAVATVLAKHSRIGLILVSTFGFAAATIALGLSPNLWIFYGFMFAFGLCVPLFSTPFMTLVQETVAPEMQGRVFSYVGIVMALAAPIGMSAFGPLADVMSVQSLLVIGGVATIAVMTLAVRTPSGRAAIRAGRETQPAAS